MVLVVAPVDHRYEEKPAPASNMTSPPLQKVVGPLAVITGIASETFKVMFVEHAPGSVEVTVYTVDAVGLAITGEPVVWLSPVAGDQV